MNIDDIKLYLPKYLSPETREQLYECLSQFPENLDYTKVYTERLIENEIIYQGDGLKDFLVVDLPDLNKSKQRPCVVLSNTCDINPENDRIYSTRILYSPIINLRSYETALKERHDEERVNGLINAIRRQEPTQIFYLPELPGKLEESFIFFDRTLNINNNTISKEEIPSRRLFTLGTYGLYLFIIKLSIHFTRIQEGIDRDNPES